MALRDDQRRGAVGTAFTIATDVTEPVGLVVVGSSIVFVLRYSGRVERLAANYVRPGAG